MNGPPTSAGDDTMVEDGSALLSVGGFMVSDAQMRNALARATQAVAQALDDPGVRSKVYNALVRSPYPEHKLHFGTTLRIDVTELLASMATASQTPETSMLSMLDSIVDLEFYMPVPEHREVWTGGVDLIVASQLFDDGTLPIAFDLAGREVRIQSAEQPPETPTLVLVPVETDFSTRRLSGVQAPSPDASPSSETPGIYMILLHTEDDHEGWPRGTPEIEIHAWRKKNALQYEDFACAGEDQSGEAYFDQDDTWWSGRVLVAAASDLDAPSVVDDRNFLTVYEDDSEPCKSYPLGEGRPPKISSGDLLGKINDFLNKLLQIKN